jgi:LysM repeat protein
LCDYNKPQLNYNCSRLSVGDYLQVPYGSCTPDEAYDCVTAKEGDSAIVFATQWNIPVDEIFSLNKDVFYLARDVYVGMQFRIPKRFCIPSETQWCYTPSKVGESLNDVAYNLGFHFPDLREANLDRALYDNTLRMDRQYIIPKTCVDKAGSYYCYKVRHGDTLYDLGVRFGVDPDLLCKQNNLMKNCSLLPTLSQWLQIPNNIEAPWSGYKQKCIPSPYQWDCYTVQAGDTLFDIARTHHVSPVKLCEYNKAPLNYNCSAILNIGVELQVPKDQCQPNPAYDCATIPKGGMLADFGVDNQLPPLYLQQVNSDVLYPYDYVYEGMQIKIPKKFCIPTSSNYCHKMGVAEDCYRIAPYFDMEYMTVYMANYDRVRGSLSGLPGRAYKIPISCEDSPGHWFCYKVHHGDTIYHLAQRFNVDWRTLCEFQGMKPDECDYLPTLDKWVAVPVSPPFEA